MKNKGLLRRILAVALAVTMLAGYAVPVGAAESDNLQSLAFEKVDNSAVSAKLPLSAVEELEAAPIYDDDEMVRVSIVLKEKSTIEAGYSTMDIAQNESAMAYRANLKQEQNDVVASIEKNVLNGGELDVVWNMTLAANIISANVAYGQIEAIEAVKGVKEVLVENRYEPMVVETDGGADPNMATSGEQIGSAAAWGAGYTGAGARIAVIDTGTDSDHQSFDSAAFDYSLSLLDGEYDLLDLEELKGLVGELNVNVTAEQAYANTKLPFGYNYVDRNYSFTHDNDNMGAHGSHVAGIATANAYIPNDEGGYDRALSSVYVQGVAPDAQLLTMKVFGANGGAYESDYIVAIEDAIILGADSVNLSLGSVNPGRASNATDAYQQIMENLVNSDTVVAISAGNSGHWADYATHTRPGYLYSADVSAHTGGAPGSFTNALTVASVENDGGTGHYIQVGDVVSVYNENTQYYQNALRTLFGEREYVFFDNVGVDAAGNNLMLEYADVVEGKIVFVSRGESDFSKKHDGANTAGAIACIVYNNQAGIFGMDLSSSWTYIPCVAITMPDAEAIRDLSTAVTDEEGNVLYYTGTMTVGSEYASSQYYSDYYTMSSFSAWGVPQSLELKPEITAPGGNIYSVDGTDYYGERYTIMSGTSMAAPQATGMAAVVAQYIRENGLDEAENMTVRALAQSLLMSTAVPMIDGNSMNYYPVLQQGAGLANVGAAVSADSYVVMNEDATDAWADGKVKAELGDDPQREGVYSFSFTLNNLTDEEKVYLLSADWFAQDVLEDYANSNFNEKTWFMDRLVADLDADTVFTVNGKTVSAADAGTEGMDFNGDGQVDADDGQYLLDYATGVETELHNADKADLNGDGLVNSYDSYLFLSMVGVAVTLPADGSVEVSVTVTLSQEQKAELDQYYENGTYVQGYVHVSGVSSAEGVEGTDHSIPVLGFYGNWSDASMYDPGNYMTYVTGEGLYMSYMNIPEVNTYTISYADRPGESFYFGGNPMVPDDVYMPERNAFNSVKGDLINEVRFSNIRNAADTRYTAVNNTTGEVLEDAIMGEVYSAFFNVNQGQWQYNNWVLTDLFFDGYGAKEGDKMELTVTLAPEYYLDDEGNVAWDALGKGADFSIPMVIDNTEPVVDDVVLDLENNTLTITASDNNYVSAVALYNKSGTKLYTVTGAKQDIEKNESAEFVLDLTGVNGKRFAVQITDYAMNTATYLIEEQIGEEVALPQMIGLAHYAGGEKYWIGFDENIELNYDYYAEYALPYYADTQHTFYAATMIDHMILASTDKGELYVMPADDMGDLTMVGYLGCVLTDMAYDKVNDVVYGVNDDGELVTVDKMSGEVEVIGKIGIDTNTLAYADGKFYGARLGTNELYTYTLETIEEPTLLAALTYYDENWYEEVNFVWDDVQAMEIDPNTGMLCWTSYSFESILYDFGWGDPFYSDRIYGYFIEVDPATGEYTVHNDIMWAVTALAIPEKPVVEGTWVDPTDQAEGVLLTENAVNVYERYSVDLNATVYPWTATDRSVTWSSADPEIASVDQNGTITGNSVGVTTITATSNLNPELSASCTVTVEKLQVTLEGVLQEANGDTVMYTWNLADEATWTADKTLTPTLTTAAMDTLNNDLYLMDGVSFSWRTHRIDPETGSIEASSSPYTNTVLWDMAYSQRFSTASAPKVVGIAEDYVLVPQDPMALSGYNISLFDYLYKYGGSVVTAITSAGQQSYYDADTNYTYDTELLYVLDDAGNVWYLWIYRSGSTYKAFISCVPSTLPELDFEGYDVVRGCSMHLGDDGDLYLSYFSGITNEIYRMAYNAEEEVWEAAKLGNFGRDVWPASITSATSNQPAVAAAMPEAIAHVEAAAMEERDVEEETNAASGSLNAVVASHPAAPQSSAETQQTEVVVSVTAKDAEGVDAASTNGVQTVTYDETALKLEKVEVLADFVSVKEEAGSVTFGYVELSGVPAGAAVAKLTFTARELADTTVTVAHEELAATLPAYEETVDVKLGASDELLKIYGTSMTLASDLTMNFYMEQKAEGWYAEITRNGETVTVPAEQWEDSNGYWRIVYPGIAAKEMTDEVTVVIRDAQGNAVTETYTDSVRAYAMRMFGQGMDTLLVDMLNYGAAAQEYFSYKTGDLANNELTDEQKALATESVTMEDGRVMGENYYGSSLALESKIELNFYFTGVTADMTAAVTWTDHYGNAKSVEADIVMNGRYAVVKVDELAVADARQLVSVEITDNGNVVASASDSVESYCARMTTLALREPLMKFADSARAFFAN